MHNRNTFTISVIIPLFNEEGNVKLLAEKLQVMLCHYPNYEIIYIDDGSTDNTLAIIKNLNQKDKRIKYISFSRNFGQQNALKAGLDYSKGDCVISMDGDLQHPPELITAMIDKWIEGYDIVYTIRKDKFKVNIFKRFFVYLFYKLMSILSDINIEQGTADFRLMDRVVVDIVCKLRENALFFRGLIPWLGFKQYGLEYVPQERFSGKSKYSISKMFKLALTGITSFSIKPLHFSTQLGLVIAFLAFIYGLYAFYIKIFSNISIPGWTSLLIVVAFIGGIQLITVGILGEYLGKLFIEQKRRPNYIVRDKDVN